MRWIFSCRMVRVSAENSDAELKKKLQNGEFSKLDKVMKMRLRESENAQS